tara:strand:+ start:45 stop:947 length:903 start_codon:yes stop_codon:yes gene_type:complete
MINKKNKKKTFTKKKNKIIMENIESSESSENSENMENIENIKKIENMDKTNQMNNMENIYEMDNQKIEKKIIKNVIKGGFCSKYKNDACNRISIKMDPIAPIADFLNFILNLVQDYPLKFLTDGFSFIINEWNIGITHLSTTLERFIILIIFSINGYTNTLNFMLDDVKLILRILVAILVNGNPFILITIYAMPVFNELLSFIVDSATLDIITSLFTFNFTPLFNLIKGFLNLLIGKTVKERCNLEDYGNNKSYMDSECYSFSVPKCKLNLRTLFYITMVIIILIYISSWISFFKLFYPD